MTQQDKDQRDEMREVEDMRIGAGVTAGEIVEQMGEGGGFSAKAIAEGVDVLERMITDNNCLKFLSFPACVTATGVRGLIRDLVKNRLVDIIMTTSGTLDHDLARVWKSYYHGSFEMDDGELHRKGINRLGNILVPDTSYGSLLEKKVRPLLKEIHEEGHTNLSTMELVRHLGNRIEDEGSIIHWASKNGIPVFIPGITDGAVGCQIWSFIQENRDFKIDVFRDEDELAGLVFGRSCTGALIIGGGISKHHTIWWNQFKGGLDYAVYISTAPEFDGSLSGARVREAVSWGKVKEDARQVHVDGEATAVLPLMLGALMERL